MKKICILGGGESGVGAAILAQEKGFEVFLSDKGTIKDNYKEELEKHQIEYEEGQHDIERILSADEVIKSPGIPDKVSLIQKLRNNGISVIGEIEFAHRYTDAKIIAITGSNGKTTTTSLIYHLLKTANLNVGLGGNIGFSFARQVAQEDFDLYVLEVSSFQLDSIQNFKPDIAILLNITPDHLDRYDYKMENYIASKFRITKNQEKEDSFIYNQEDDNIKKFLSEKDINAKHYKIETTQYIKDHSFNWEKCSIKGKHNRFNAECAIQAAKIIGLDKDVIQKGLETFESIPHRLEKVAEIEGIEYINDSKATNVDAVFYALDAMTKNTIWIVGGTDKGNDYSPLIPLVQEKVKAIVCLGLDNHKILEAFDHFNIKIIETKSAAAAVTQSSKLAESGDVVLLSPACASFDLFKNYIDRGNQFKKAVNSIKPII